MFISSFHSFFYSPPIRVDLWTYYSCLFPRLSCVISHSSIVLTPSLYRKFSDSWTYEGSMSVKETRGDTNKMYCRPCAVFYLGIDLRTRRDMKSWNWSSPFSQMTYNHELRTHTDNNTCVYVLQVAMKKMATIAL